MIILFYAGSSSDGKCMRTFPRTAFNISVGCRRRFTFEPMCQSSRIPTMAALLSRMATARRASRMATARRATRKPRIRVLEVLFRNVIRYAATRSFLSKLQQKDCARSGRLPLCLHASVLFRCYSRRRIGGKPMHFPFPCAEGFSKMGEQFNM